MSQSIDYQKVMTVLEAKNYQSEFAPLLAGILRGAPAGVAQGVTRCCGHEHSKSQMLYAPSEMQCIQADYNEHLMMAERTLCVAKVEQLKVAAIATLVKSQENLLVSDAPVVAARVEKIIQANTVAETKAEVRETFREIKRQHAKAFVSHVVAAVKESAISVGFADVKISNKEQKIHIVATNLTGQNFVAELGDSEQVDIHTELIGFTDGSCKKVMEAFDTQMEAHGITTGHKEKKAKQNVRRVFSDETTVDAAKSADKITIKNQ